jgi:hypothetical protein
MIFHDGSCDFLISDSAKLVKVSKEDIWAFCQLDKVNELLSKFRPIATNDITFKNSLYSLLQFSKFDLMRFAKANTDSSSFLWVDAGISRFLNKSYGLNNIEKNVGNLLNRNVKYMFEIDLRNNLKYLPLHISNSIPGTCKRVISGTAFWINGECVDLFTNKIHTEIEEWITAGVWDNEQVMLRKILPHLTDVNYVVQWNSPTGSVARSLLNEDKYNHKYKNNLIQKLMLRAERLL